MLGLGPGALPTRRDDDRHSLEEQRGAFEEDVDVLMAILRGEKVTKKTSRYNLIDAPTPVRALQRLRHRGGRDREPDGSARGRSKNGVHLLSVGATAPEGGFDALGHALGRHGGAGPAVRAHPRSRRLAPLGPMHLAETKEQAIRGRPPRP